MYTKSVNLVIRLLYKLNHFHTMCKEHSHALTMWPLLIAYDTWKNKLPNHLLFLCVKITVADKLNKYHKG